MSFTKKELYEIEKLFDNQAGEVTRNAAHYIDALSKSPEANKITTKFINDVLAIYELCRTISAKASKMREKNEL